MLHKTNTVDSYENLRSRIVRLLEAPVNRSKKRTQLSLNLPNMCDVKSSFNSPSNSVSGFLDFILNSLPHGDIYLFGGLIRDIALFGKKGFNSDIDLVVEGSWDHCIDYLEHLGAVKNKFGGYRLMLDDWPIDIWNARETWAIKYGLVKYSSIYSLTKTTVLNWDAILMDWRTKRFIHCDGYLDAIKERQLDIVLKDNPNPLGMAVRVYRHLCSKDAKKITPSAATYLANCTSLYSYEKLVDSEFSSYGNTVIEHAIYNFFEGIKKFEDLDIKKRFDIATNTLNEEGIALSFRQSEWGLRTI